MGKKENLNIAIVGGGASGLTSAFFLQDQHQVMLFEKDDHLGGAAVTVRVPSPSGEKEIIVDPAFHILNKNYYSHFLKLLKLIDVEVEEITLPDGSYNYFSSYNPMSWVHKSLHTRKDKLLLSMLMIKLVNSGKKILEDNDYTVTLNDFVRDNKWLSRELIRDFITPLVVAWGLISEGEDEYCARFPVLFLLIFAREFGLENIFTYRLHRIKEGSGAYIDKLTAHLRKTTIKTGCAVKRIQQRDAGFLLTDASGKTFEFDHVIFSCNPASILEIMPDIYCAATLQKMPVVDINVITHSDPGRMPNDRKEWAFYNKIYMPLFRKWTGAMWQGCREDVDVFVTYGFNMMLQDHSVIQKVHDVRHFSYPVISPDTVGAREAIKSTQGKDNIWITGYHMGDIYLHEDAIRSAIDVVTAISPGSPRLLDFHAVQKVYTRSFGDKCQRFLIRYVAMPLFRMIKPFVKKN